MNAEYSDSKNNDKILLIGSHIWMAYINFFSLLTQSTSKIRNKIRQKKLKKSKNIWMIQKIQWNIFFNQLKFNIQANYEVNSFYLKMLMIRQLHDPTIALVEEKNLTLLLGWLLHWKKKNFETKIKIRP